MFKKDTDNTTPIPLPHLLPGESFYNIEYITPYIPTKPPSSINELQRLARVKAESEIGTLGPTMAALALERSDVEVSPELRKYETLFGRDSLRVAIDLLPIYPRLMHITIRKLAELQGIEMHTAREEEPGKIIHELRTPDDPIGREITEKYGWEWPYYGSVDASLQFMSAIYLYTTRAPNGEAILQEQYIGRDQQTHTIGEAYRNTLKWAEKKLEENAEGLIEYKSPLSHGIENQVWRDSWDCYFHADGTLANQKSGIASVEVQQLAYDALLQAAEIHESQFDDPERAIELRAKASELRDKIIKIFWVPEKGGFFALGTDRDDQGNLRQLKIRTSNMGHLLHSRLFKGEEYRHYHEAIVAQLFSPEMLNVSGIRTLANDEVRFRPGAYHNGSVWLWDTYYCAEGLRHHGYFGLATVLADKIHSVINVTQKFPEYVRGDSNPIPTLNDKVVDIWDENAKRMNRIEQPPQEVQAWSVAADIARAYYSGRVPARAMEARAVRIEDAILGTLEL